MINRRNNETVKVDKELMLTSSSFFNKVNLVTGDSERMPESTSAEIVKEVQVSWGPGF
jgi:hypothetical protein